MPIPISFNMELIGTAHQILQALTPSQSGRPRVVSSAIRSSMVVAAMGLNNVYRPLEMAPVAAVAGALTLSLILSRSFLENSDLTSDHIGRTAFIALQVIYTLAFILISSPLWRRVRPLF